MPGIALVLMKAWAVGTPGPIDEHPLVEVARPVPEPGPGQVRVRVEACGLCRTDLHLAEGDLTPRRELVPGHEVVGRVEPLGEGGPAGRQLKRGARGATAPAPKL